MRPSAERDRWRAAALVAPAYAWLAVAVFLPLLAMLWFSFLDKSPLLNQPASPTLHQYAQFFERGFYRFLTWRSLELGFWVTLWCIVIGYPSALLLARHVSGRSREALLLLIVLPFWSNALVRVFSWTMVLRSDGLIDEAIRLVVPGWTSNGLLFSYSAIVIGLVHSFVPYMILTCYLSIEAIDKSWLEAASSLGSPHLTTFRLITLPLSLPGLAVGAVLIFVPVTGAFMEPRILGGTAGMTLGTVIEDQFTEVFNWPLGAALSFILLGIVLAILALSRLVARASAWVRE